MTNRVQWSSESPEVFERFHETVASLCSKAMSFFDSDWYSSSRNAQYMVAVDKVLETMGEQKLTKCDSIESALDARPGSSGSEVISPNQPDLYSPSPWSSISNKAMTLDSSPTSAMSCTSTGSSKRPELSSGNTSLTTSSQASVSPTSLAPNTPTTSTVSCRSCSTEFTGRQQDAKSNLQRHFRESHKHNKNAGRKCPLPKCRAKDPMRSDNLRPHLQNFHKLSPSDTNDIIDQIKSSARRVDKGGIARRRPRQNRRQRGPPAGLTTLISID